MYGQLYAIMLITWCLLRNMLTWFALTTERHIWMMPVEYFHVLWLVLHVFFWSVFHGCAWSTKNLINWAKNERERIYSRVPYPPLFEIVYAKRYWVTSVLHVDSVWFLSLLPSLLQLFRETIFILRHLLRTTNKSMRMERGRKYLSIVDRFRLTDGCNRPIRRYMQTGGYYSPICQLGALSWAVCQFHLPGPSHAFTRGQSELL